MKRSSELCKHQEIDVTFITDGDADKPIISGPDSFLGFNFLNQNQDKTQPFPPLTSFIVYRVGHFPFRLLRKRRERDREARSVAFGETGRVQTCR